MNLRNWFRSLMANQTITRSKRPTPKRKPGFRPAVEVLEDRTVPSASISVANASINEVGNVSAFIGAGSGGLNSPKDLVLGPDGNVYVASSGTNSVIRYTAAGQLLGTFVTASSGGLSSPKGMAFGPDGNLYVVSVTNNSILEYNGSTGAFISTLVSAGSGGLNNPSGMVFGQDGNLYVSSCGTESVDRFQGPLGSTPGSPLPSAGQSGATFVAPGSGGLAGPNELIFGPNGNLFVSNGLTVSGVSDNNYGVLEFDPTTGSFITTYVASNHLTIPRGIAFDQEGRLYVADQSTNAIHRFDSQGNYMDDPVTGSASSLASPMGIVFDTQGGLLVSSRDTNAVGRYVSGLVVTLSAASPTPVSVDYVTADGTATAGTDYTAQTGTVTFAPGQTSRRILLATLPDLVPISNDAFNIQLSNPTGGASIANGNAVVTIVQPAWPQLTIGNTSAIEADTTAHYRGAFIQSPGNQFNPVIFGPDGNLYTAVGTGPGYNTIQRYNGSTGAFMGTFASGPINGVRTILFRSGYMYVASEYTNQVLQYNATTGAYVGVFVEADSNGINGPNGMAMDSAGNLYVAGRNSNTIGKYDTNGNLVWVTPAGSGGLSLPEGMTVDPSGTYLYVANSGGPSNVLKFNTQTGAFVGVAASSGINSPHSVAFGPDGLLYVSSGANNRILRFTSNGMYVDDYVPAGSGGLNSPHAINFGPNGDLYVATTGNDSIFQYGTENEAQFTVSLSTAFVLPVTVTYATADGTAHAGTNYTATSGTLTFGPEVTSETIRVPILDSGSQTTSLTFTVNLSSPLAATISNGQGVGTILPSDTPAKFYVVNGSNPSIGGTNTTFKYQASGSPEAPYGLSLNDLNPRGVATTAAGSTEWVVDANKNVYVYSTGGVLLGSWTPGGLSSSAQLTGIATDGSNIWLVDSYADKVYKYTGAASRLSGSQSAASSFSLVSGKNGNTNPQDIVTDGTSIWVVDGTALKVFKYSLSGSSLGSWSIDSANKHPTGITINPANVSDIWIVDNGTDKVYQYIGAAGRTSGSQNAAATFALNPNDTNPQGIADPPPASMMISQTLVPSQPAGAQAGAIRLDIGVSWGSPINSGPGNDSLSSSSNNQVLWNPPLTTQLLDTGHASNLRNDFGALEEIAATGLYRGLSSGPDGFDAVILDQIFTDGWENLAD